MFPSPVAQGTTYAVSVVQQPAGEQCSFENASGTVGASDVTELVLNCFGAVAVGGSVTGLDPLIDVELANGEDRVVVSLDGTFVFPRASGRATRMTSR